LIPVVGSIALYFLFNQVTAGSWLPTTFFAKQAEYSSALYTPLGARYFALISLPMIGAGIILLPGLLVYAIKIWKEKNWVAAAAFLWWLGITLIYALRLPVTYQYGRYLVPAMPVYFLLGFAGLQACFDGLIKIPVVQLPGENQARRTPELWSATRRIIGLSWKAILVTTWLLFAGLGGYRYSSDVGIINTEMVAVAKWINANTPRNAILAVHDIGAVGYFADRSIIDLAGLVSPEVIPFIRNESELAAYLDRAHAAYLVTFPSWYDTLARDRRVLFQTQGIFSPESGGENLAVYAWP
jgi:hypothetical protein